MGKVSTYDWFGNLVKHFLLVMLINFSDLFSWSVIWAPVFGIPQSFQTFVAGLDLWPPEFKKDFTTVIN